MYDGQKYITLTRQPVIKKSHVTIMKEDKDYCNQDDQTVFLPAQGVEKFTRYLCCAKCLLSVLHNDGDSKVVRCSSCNCGQLKSKCKTLTIAKVLCMENDEQVTITLFDETLREIYDIYKNENTSSQISKTYDALTEDKIMEYLLLVNAKLVYNKNFSVTSVSSI